MSRATVDLQTIRFFLGYGLIFFVQHVITIVAVTAVLFVYEWRLALIALAITPLLIGIAYRYSHVSHPVLRDVQQKLADVATVSEESIVGVHVVKSFAQEEQRRGALPARRRRGLPLERAGEPAAGAVRAAAHVPALLAQAAVLLAAGRTTSCRASSRSAASSPSTCCSMMLVVPLRMLGMWIGQAQRATASGERIFEVIDEPEEVADAPGAGELPDGPGRVVFEGVDFGYDADRPVLHDIDLEVEPGTHRGADRRHRLGQDDARLARAAVLRRHRGARARRRRRRARRDARARCAARSASSPRTRSSSRRASATTSPSASRTRREEQVEARRPRRPGARVHRAAARRLRHRHRRARHHALGRAAAAARDRPGARDRPAHPHPRRRHRLGRRDHRGRASAPGSPR